MKRRFRVALSAAVILGTVYLVGPYEPVETERRFDASVLAQGVDAHLTASEARFDDIRPDSAKRVIWAGAPETKTDWAVVYFHGFSASSQEIRPVPDDVAAALGANLVFTRFKGHGRDFDAMGQMRATDWMYDADEALSIARAVGDKVLLIGNSTGASLGVIAAADPDLSANVAGMVLIAPNFALQNPMAPLLSLPAARHWLPALAGRERSFEPRNPGQAKEWTTRYPSTAVFPMAATARRAKTLDHSDIDVPSLFLYAEADKVVRSEATAKVVASWGGPVAQELLEMTPQDDPRAHVVAGDIMSPAMTPRVIEAIVNWTKGL